MYASAVRYMIRRGIRRINAGDYGPLLSSFADDATQKVVEFDKYLASRGLTPRSATAVARDED